MGSPSQLRRERLEALERRHAPSAATPAPLPKTPSSGLRRAGTGKSPLSQPPRRQVSVSTPEDQRSYAPLPESVFHGDVGARLQLTATADNTQAIPSLLSELWSKNPKAMKEMNSMLDKGVNQVLMLDNPTTHRMYADKARAKAQQCSQRSSRRLSLTQHRRLGSFHLDQQYLRFDLFLPLHEMWREYMNNLIAGCNEAVVQSRILTADLHGANMEVVDSKTSGFVGTKGFMIRETENTFGILTAADKFRVVPKRGSIFMLQLEGQQVTFFGNNLSLRSMQQEKTQKLKPTIEL